MSIHEIVPHNRLQHVATITAAVVRDATKYDEAPVDAVNDASPLMAVTLLLEGSMREKNDQKHNRFSGTIQ